MGVDLCVYFLILSVNHIVLYSLTFILYPKAIPVNLYLKTDHVILYQSLHIHSYDNFKIMKYGNIEPPKCFVFTVLAE